jgi:lactoylglutathione lyase
MAKAVHSMIRVFDEAKSLDFYARALGLEVADHLEFPGFALIYLRHPSSPFEVELFARRRLRPSCRSRR